MKNLCDRLHNTSSAGRIMQPIRIPENTKNGIILMNLILCLSLHLQSFHKRSSKPDIRHIIDMMQSIMSIMYDGALMWFGLRMAMKICIVWRGWSG